MLIFRLKKIRQSLRLSRSQLSKLSGVNESTIQMIENSENPNPTFKVMCMIADAISLDELRGNVVMHFDEDISRHPIDRRATNDKRGI